MRQALFATFGPALNDSETGDERDRGSVTVEAALGICSIVAVFTLGFSAISLVTGQLRCTDAAVEAARLTARGDKSAADAVARIAPNGAALHVRVHHDQATVEVRSRPLGSLLPVELVGRAYSVLEPGVARAS